MVNSGRALETMGENLESQVVNETVDMGSLSQVGVADVEMKIKAKTTSVSVEFANKGKQFVKNAKLPEVLEEEKS